MLNIYNKYMRRIFFSDGWETNKYTFQQTNNPLSMNKDINIFFSIYINIKEKCPFFSLHQAFITNPWTRQCSTFVIPSHCSTHKSSRNFFYHFFFYYYYVVLHSFNFIKVITIITIYVHSHRI